MGLIEPAPLPPDSLLAQANLSQIAIHWHTCGIREFRRWASTRNCGARQPTCRINKCENMHVNTYVYVQLYMNHLPYERIPRVWMMRRIGRFNDQTSFISSTFSQLSELRASQPVCRCHHGKLQHQRRSSTHPYPPSKPAWSQKCCLWSIRTNINWMI